jgi:hypothetical protein
MQLHENPKLQRREILFRNAGMQIGAAGHDDVNASGSGRSGQLMLSLFCSI